MSLEEFKNIEDLYKAKTFGTIHVRKVVLKHLYSLFQGRHIPVRIAR